MSGSLEGKVAVVTGAGRGLGRSHALALAAQGAAVVVNDLGGSDRGEGADTGPAFEVVNEIHALGGKAVASTDSVSDWGSASRLIDTAYEEFGRLDILVNNAGISRFGTLDAGTSLDWDLTIAANLTGSATTTYWASQRWKAIGPEAGRAIVNTSSPAGTNPQAGSTAYCVSKMGTIALTIATAGELAHLGVRVNALAPMARTRLTDAVKELDEIMKKPEHGFDRVAPENVSPLVTYLASPRCRFTGRVFGVEGDDIYLFDGFSANNHFNNGQKQWTSAAIARALETVERQDRGFMILPSGRIPGAQPSDDALHILERLR
jgi:NAD(P)-dependent dehydrogenase (short-subunit alcohol dehydrogenase family)